MSELTSIANFTVSNRCNGQCTTCNIWKMDPRPDPTIKQITGFFEENSGILRNLKSIQLTGGEPFLRDDLPEIASAVHNIAPNCMIWIPTNGLQPEKIQETTIELLRQTDKPLIGVTISLDGEGEVHDIQRGVDGSYKKAVQTLKFLSDLKKKTGRLHLSTGFTLTADNYLQAPIVQRISYKHGANFSIRPVNISEHYYQNTEQNGDFNPDEVWTTVKYLAHLVRNEKGMRNSLTMLAYLRGIKEFIGDGRTLPCSAAKKSVFIDGVGDVFPCLVMNHKLGNAYEVPLKEILASEETNNARDIISELQCPTCWLECEVYRDIKKDWMRLLDAYWWGFKQFS
jgi:MoaA/NifB/PqqE/SkfB family radical SAM enzyme